MRHPTGDLHRLRSGRILVQQESEVGRGNIGADSAGGDCQEHLAIRPREPSIQRLLCQELTASPRPNRAED
jgi:hypothetical protein